MGDCPLEKKMRKREVWKRVCCWCLIVMAAVTGTVRVHGAASENGESKVAYVCAMVNGEADGAVDVMARTRAADIPTVSFGEMSHEELEELLLYPGGMPFGIKFYTEGVTVVGTCDVETASGKVNPAADAGLRAKDMILRVNGEVLGSASQLTEAIENSGGNALKMSCKRGAQEFEVTLKPAYCTAESRYKTGLWVRDSGAGIGTVTFIMPETGAFAGLGHGICDADTGALVAMRRGSVSDVTISSVVKGAAGAPGELKGYFNAGKVGALLGNSTCGVWGVFSEVPECPTEPMQIGLRDDIEEGDAYLMCTLDTNKIESYDIKISNVNRDAKGSKCFTVTVTDPDLIAASGGIVQGMSGSPIIQNGKLVGAVTHVLINDPTMGYGIFLENMLVNMPVPAR